MYDKNVNRKSKVHFNPRQTLEYLKSNTANMEISFQTKRNIVKQYLDVSISSPLYLQIMVKNELALITVSSFFTINLKNVVGGFIGLLFTSSMPVNVL